MWIIQFIDSFSLEELEIEFAIILVWLNDLNLVGALKKLT